MLQNKGLLKTGRNTSSIRSLPIPNLRDDEILVEVKAIALNPADWQNLDEEMPEKGDGVIGGYLQGHDAAGIIVAMGRCVEEEGRLRVGERVAVLGHGVNELCSTDGAFANYIAVNGSIAIKIPEEMSFVEAATLPSGIITIGLDLYHHLKLPLPPPLSHTPPPLPPSLDNEEKEYILIYGGSTATRTLAIQFAKLSGLKVVTTCSPANFELLRGLNADERDPNCASKIRTLTGDKLVKVFDTIAISSSAKFCGDAMASDSQTKKIYVNLMHVLSPSLFGERGIENVFFLGYSGLGREFVLEGKRFPAVLEDYEFASRFAVLAGIMLERGLVKTHPVALRSGGLEGIVGGHGGDEEGHGGDEEGHGGDEEGRG